MRIDVQEDLRRGRFIVMQLAEWEAVAQQFEVLEAHDTRLAGRLLLVRGAGGLAVVEQPEPKLRVLRPFKDKAAARAFVAARLAAYERMWDGCGCRIDYYN
jgi:hypothetical protein